MPSSISQMAGISTSGYFAASETIHCPRIPVPMKPSFTFSLADDEKSVLGITAAAAPAAAVVLIKSRLLILLDIVCSIYFKSLMLILTDKM